MLGLRSFSMLKKYSSLVSKNWKSGLTVGLVSIPLSLSLSVASGASPEAGLVTAVWAGAIAALLGGSNFNVVGPAGALTGVLLGFALTMGPGLLPMLAVSAGALILLAYALRLETYLALVPKSVMHGFSLGVALTIAASQVPSAIGIEPSHVGHVLGAFLENIGNSAHASMPALVLFAGSMLLLFLFSRIFMKLPAALFVAPIGIAIGYLSSRGVLTGDLVILAERFPSMSFALFRIPSFSFDFVLLAPALSVAFIAILETLISAKIADGMTGTKFNARREIFGLGLANIASGAFGGLPATGVFVRTGLNVKSGATHRTSSLINAVFVAAVSALIFSTFTLIPMPVIAAILVFSAVRMVETHALAYVYNQSKREFVIAMLVAIVMLAVDSVVGLVSGIVIALLYYVKEFSKGHYEIVTGSIASDARSSAPEQSYAYTYLIKGNLSYLNADTHQDRIKEITESFKNVTIDMSGCVSADFDGRLMLKETIRDLRQKGYDVSVRNVPDFLAEAFVG